MAAFATESGVRQKFQLTDGELVPSALIETSIGDAHAEVLRHLEPVFDTGSPEAGLILGETLLAGAHLYRSLAAREAFDRKQISIGGQEVHPGGRCETLIAVAVMMETSAWRILEPYLVRRPQQVPLDATDTGAILGVRD